MISIKKIKGAGKVKPLKIIEQIDEKNIKGSAYLPLYSNTFILAKKNSGKTTTIAHLLKNIVGLDTNIYIFCSTVYKDISYKEIVKTLENKGANVFIYTSIYENGENVLNNIINNMTTEDDDFFNSSDSEDEEEEQEPKIINCENYSEIIENKKRIKPRKITAKNIFLFDDLSNELKSPEISYLLKRNRHFLSKTIISSQYIHDLKPESIMQLDIMILFGNIPIEKLKIIYKLLDLGSLDFNLFLKYYEIATKEKYNFLKIDIRKEKFYINFNYIINNK